MTKEIKASEGPYGLIRLEGMEECYVNSNGIYSETGEPIPTEKAKRLLGIPRLGVGGHLTHKRKVN